MPQVNFTKVSSRMESKPFFFDFGEDTTLDKALKKTFPEVNKANFYIIASSDEGKEEVIDDWCETNIGVCQLLSENLIVYKKPHKLVEALVKRENNGEQTIQFYLPSDTRIHSITEMVEKKIKLNEKEFIQLNYSSIHKDDMLASDKERVAKLSYKIFSEKDRHIRIESFTGQHYFISCEPSDTIQDIKERIQHKEGIPLDQMRLVFGGEQLEDEKTLFDCNIKFGSTVFLYIRLIGGGGCSMTFVDVSNKNGPQKRKWSSRAPNWRIAHGGLNLEGKCTNRECEAYRQMVIIPMGLCVTFQLGMPGYTTKCPMCYEHVNVDTCGFSNCEWRTFGIKKTKTGGFERFKSEWTEADDNYYRFDEKRNGVCDWTYLVLESRSMENNPFESNNGIASILESSKKISEKLNKIKIEDSSYCVACIQNMESSGYELECHSLVCLPCLDRLSQSSLTQGVIKCPECQEEHIAKARLQIEP